MTKNRHTLFEILNNPEWVNMAGLLKAIEKLNLTKRTIYKYISEGMPSEKYSGVRVFPKYEAITWIERTHGNR